MWPRYSLYLAVYVYKVVGLYHTDEDLNLSNFDIKNHLLFLTPRPTVKNKQNSIIEELNEYKGIQPNNQNYTHNTFIAK